MNSKINLCRDEQYYLNIDQIHYMNNSLISSTQAFHKQIEEEFNIGQIISIQVNLQTIIKLVKVNNHNIMITSQFQITLFYINCLGFIVLRENDYIIFCYEDQLKFVFLQTYSDNLLEISSEVQLKGKIEYLGQNEYLFIIGVDLQESYWKIYYLFYEKRNKQIIVNMILDESNTNIKKIISIKTSQEKFYIMDEKYIYQFIISTLYDNYKIIKDIQNQQDEVIIDFEVIEINQEYPEIYYKILTQSGYYLKNKYSKIPIQQNTQIIPISQNKFILKNENTFIFGGYSQQLSFSNCIYFKLDNNILFIQEANKFHSYFVFQSYQYLTYQGQNEINIKSIQLLSLSQQNIITNTKILFDKCQELIVQNMINKEAYNLKTENYQLFEKECGINSQFTNLIYLNDLTSHWLIQNDFVVELITCENGIVRRLNLDVLEYQLQDQDICQQSIVFQSYMYIVNKNTLTILQIKYQEFISVYKEYTNEPLASITQQNSLCFIAFENNKEYKYFDDKILNFRSVIHPIFNYKLSSTYQTQLLVSNNEYQIKRKQQLIHQGQIKSQASIFMYPDLLVFLQDNQTISIYKIIVDGQLLFCYNLTFSLFTFSQAFHYSIFDSILAIKIYNQKNKPYLVILDAKRTKQESVQQIIPLNNLKFYLFRNDTIILYNSSFTCNCNFKSITINKDSAGMLENYQFILIVIFGFIIQLWLTLSKLKKNKNQIRIDNFQ